jgi:anaerobic selenocysteine-containing dehydrogenase
MNAPLPHSPVVRTTCPYCGVGCGVLAAPDGVGGATIFGDPEHPANFGRLCSKGSALGETLSLDQRLLHPMLRHADGALTRTSWDVALDRVAGGLRDIADRHGPSAIAFYLSGQLLTEDYYAANKLSRVTRFPPFRHWHSGSFPPTDGQNLNENCSEISYFFGYEARRNILGLSASCISTMNFARELVLAQLKRKSEIVSRIT